MGFEPMRNNCFNDLANHRINHSATYHQDMVGFEPTRNNVPMIFKTTAITTLPHAQNK